jgi:hypothetical protein
VKSEEDFRIKFQGALKPYCKTWYMSSMTRAGIPDIHVLFDGRAGWFELKFARELPKRDSSNVLDHKFLRQQVEFMKSAVEHGTSALGVIAYGDNKVALLAPPSIEKNGGVTRGVLLSHRPLILDENFGVNFLARALPGI